MANKTTTLKRNQIAVTLTLKLDITTVDAKKELLESLDKGYGVCYQGDIVNAEEELDQTIIDIASDMMTGFLNEEEIEELINAAHIEKTVYETKTINITDLDPDLPESLKNEK